MYGFLLLHLLLCCRVNCIQSRASESNSTGHSTFNAPRNLHTHTPDRWNGMCSSSQMLMYRCNDQLITSTKYCYRLWPAVAVVSVHLLVHGKCVEFKNRKIDCVESNICEWRPERKFFESCKHRMTVSVLPMKEVTTITTNCLCFDRNNDKTGEFEVW